MKIFFLLGLSFLEDMVGDNCVDIVCLFVMGSYFGVIKCILVSLLVGDRDYVILSVYVGFLML